MSGFAKLKIEPTDDNAGGRKLDLSDFAPTAHERRGDPETDQAIADRIARRRGLAEEPVQRVALKRGSIVNDKIFISGPLRVLNRFRELCNDLGGKTYAEVLERLMDNWDDQPRR